MTDTTEAFFEEIAERRYEPLLHMVSGSIQFIIEGAGIWIVNIKNGSITISKELTTSNDSIGADSVVICSKEDFDNMVVGKQNPITLWLQMRMKWTGNLGLAQVFQRLFPVEKLAGAQIGN